MAKVIMLLIKFLLAALAVVLFFLAAYAGMLHNYLIYFLTLSAVLMVITLAVAAFKKSIFGKANFLAENNRPLPIQFAMNSGLKKGYMRNDVIEGLSGQ